MQIQLIRHSTLLIHYNGKKLLIDPMLSPAGAMPTAANSANSLPNPLVNLTVSIAELLTADTVLLTHSHRDHFDTAAAALLPKSMHFFCQPPDAGLLRSQSFVQVEPIETAVDWQGIRITRTNGQHGTGDIGKRMGPVSGYVLQAPDEPTLYITGDTIWCREVEQALEDFSPDVVVVFAGGAQFLSGGPITMTGDDILQVCKHSVSSQIVAAHMECWNHCLMTRSDLSDYIKRHQLQERVHIPNDGDMILFTAALKSVENS